VKWYVEKTEKILLLFWGYTPLEKKYINFNDYVFRLGRKKEGVRNFLS